MAGNVRTEEGAMARIAIEMPRLGYDMETGKIAAWTRQVGDVVARGDVLAEIETEKSTVEMEALAGGTLVEQTLGVGLEVPVGTVIGYLEDGD
jgi:pyruvate dehydrogenase E2 component (dihydrolipoamide acetyltransferase)